MPATEDQTAEIPFSWAVQRISAQREVQEREPAVVEAVAEQAAILTLAIVEGEAAQAEMEDYLAAAAAAVRPAAMQMPNQEALEEDLAAAAEAQ